jgi:predicted  nucleic acid-binding Zn-ribbon protein
VSSRRIRRWIEKPKITNPAWRRSMVEIEQELKEARKHYYVTKKEAGELRRVHNDALYKAMADKQGTQMKQVKRNMNQIKKQRKQA